ncbi:MAG: hypothetical protein LBP25_05735 [Tannerellaceae bacterium]|jgi:bacteriorhodopsin|nr:hypothetical protein [Tannerellaceae bacterium]
MNEKDFDRLLDEALHIPLPEGLANRLAGQIDRYAAEEKKRTRRRLFRAISAVAAVLLAAGIFLTTERTPRAPADTFADPAEAALAAEHALAFMSSQLNKGLNRVSAAGQEFERVNKTIEKHFKK